jgi:hypothetical protein
MDATDVTRARGIMQNCQASLHQRLAAKTNLDSLQRALYFALELLRQRSEAYLQKWRGRPLPLANACHRERCMREICACSVGGGRRRALQWAPPPTRHESQGASPAQVQQTAGKQRATVGTRAPALCRGV